MEAVEGDGTAASEQLEECNRRLREVTEERDALAGQVDAQDEQLTSLRYVLLLFCPQLFALSCLPSTNTAGRDVSQLR
jgi:hypothetical protein